jgi:HlyD family secretion protein
MVNGKVKHVSADASERGAREAQTGTPILSEGADANTGLSYRALVALAGVDRSASGAPLRLSPGMQVSAEILLGTRSVFEYLVSPVQKVAHEAARER